jgi:hypothetical protein
MILIIIEILHKSISLNHRPEVICDQIIHRIIMTDQTNNNTNTSMIDMPTTDTSDEKSIMQVDDNDNDLQLERDEEVQNENDEEIQIQEDLRKVCSEIMKTNEHYLIEDCAFILSREKNSYDQLEKLRNLASNQMLTWYEETILEGNKKFTERLAPIEKRLGNYLSKKY